MKILIKTTIVLSIIFLSAWSLSAQNYTNGIGLRIGSPLSVSFKHFTSESSAFEVFASYSRRSYSYGNWTQLGLSANYQKHTSLDFVEGLTYFYGGGLTVYKWGYSNNTIFESADDLSYGIYAIGGLEYKFPNHPVAISIDWTPTYLLNGYINGFYSRYAALSVRYVLGGE